MHKLLAFLHERRFSATKALEMKKIDPFEFCYVSGQLLVAMNSNLRQRKVRLVAGLLLLTSGS